MVIIMEHRNPLVSGIVSLHLHLTLWIDYIQESLTIPKGPNFQRLIQLFSDSDDDIRYYRSNCYNNYYYNFQKR